MGGALAIEALTQAVRHAAFMVPAGLGVQEAAVVLLAQMFGVDRNVALSLALVKRMREVIFGCIALASWQWAELARARLRPPVNEPAAAPAAKAGAGAGAGASAQTRKRGVAVSESAHEPRRYR